MSRQLIDRLDTTIAQLESREGHGIAFAGTAIDDLRQLLQDARDHVAGRRHDGLEMTWQDIRQVHRDGAEFGYGLALRLTDAQKAGIEEAAFKTGFERGRQAGPRPAGYQPPEVANTDDNG